MLKKFPNQQNEVYAMTVINKFKNGFRYVQFINYAYTSFSMFASTSNDFFEREWITFIEPGRYFIVEINGKIGGQI